MGLENYSGPTDGTGFASPTHADRNANRRESTEHTWRRPVSEEEGATAEAPAVNPLAVEFGEDTPTEQFIDGATDPVSARALRRGRHQ
jgi:hypothetical protein